MARRAPWGAALHRTLNALSRAGTRAVMNATRQALRASLPKAPAKRPARAARVIAKRATSPLAKASPRWLGGIATTPLGMRRYRLCKPTGARKREPLPLLVLLHGCTQDAAAIARSTHVPRLAAREDFIVLCPERDRFANAQHCWNWFELQKASGARARTARAVQRGQRRASVITDYAIGARIVATLCEVRGLAHAWSGGGAGQPYSDPRGPDAMRMIWAFAARVQAGSAQHVTERDGVTA